MEKIETKYEKLEIKNVESLKQPTIYFYLKNNGFSENYIKHLRNVSGAILLNGSAVNVRAKIKNDDVLEIDKNPNKATKFAPCEANLDILFEDEDYLIVNKPHNLTCNPTRSHFSHNLGSSVCTYMKEKDDNFVLRILNRLDRETAGIVVIAKNVRAYNEMTDFEKEYHAICHGKIEKDFIINKPILTVVENGINQMKRVVDEKGKNAVTHVRVQKHLNVIKSQFKPASQELLTLPNMLNETQQRKTSSTFTLVTLTLETGRTHQIRVHLSSVGHPLLGDTIYGNNKEFHTSKQKVCQNKEKNINAQKLCPSNAISSAIEMSSKPHERTFQPHVVISEATCKMETSPLHAMLLLKKISFTHFRTKQKIELEVPYPQDWNFLSKLQ